MRDQATSLWGRHKDSLVPRIGQMLGPLFESLGKTLFPEGIAAAIRLAFDGLAEAQKDLLSGGVQIAPLPYDQALSLTYLVERVSKHRVVLILDAWEKSPSIRSEITTLESFLKALNVWPHTHVFLAVRNPELDYAKADQAYQRARDLCKISRAAEVYQLGPMDLESPNECLRVVHFVRERVAGGKDLSE